MGGFFKIFRIESKFIIYNFHSVWNRPLKDDENFSGESHDFSEFVCVCSGNVGITADTKLYTLSAGQCVYHKPNEFHNIWALSQAPEVIVISFDSYGLPPCTDGVFNMTAQELLEIRNIYTALITQLKIANDKDANRHDNGYELAAAVKRLEIFLTETCVAARREEKYYRTASADTFSNIVSVMRELLDKMPSKNEIADRCGISISHMGKVITRYTGHSAMEYFTLMKMQKALDLLKSGQSIKQTAYSLGYDDPSYFSKVFKKHTGYAPIHFCKKSTPPPEW